MMATISALVLLLTFGTLSITGAIADDDNDNDFSKAKVVAHDAGDSQGVFGKSKLWRSDE